LTLSDCEGSIQDHENLVGLPNLQTLRLRYSDNVSSGHASVAKWASKCRQLQYFYDGVALNADELSRFSNHEAPLFVQVSMDKESSNVLQALSNIPTLVAMNVVVEEDAPDNFHTSLKDLTNVQQFNWSNGTLNKEFLESLTGMKSLRTARFQAAARLKTTSLKAFTNSKSCERYPSTTN
jgi:hypothetical protein